MPILRQISSKYSGQGLLAEAEGALGLPGEKEADIARHPPGILEYLGPEMEAERPQMIAPEFVTELGSAL
jgi:hypothetical protein